MPETYVLNLLDGWFSHWLRMQNDILHFLKETIEPEPVGIIPKLPFPEWSDVDLSIKEFRLQVWRLGRQHGFEDEIERNLFIIENDNKGITYLQKLNKLANRIDSYSSTSTNYFNKIRDYHKKDHRVFDIQHESDVIDGVFGQAYDTILETLRGTVWYKNHNDLIKVNGFKRLQPAGLGWETSVLTTTNQEPEPTESSEKDLDLNVKVLLAYQSGILSGTFHTLPPEKQYEILALLFGKSIGNVKNALTAMYGNANTDKNPKNKPKVVEKTNNLITEKDLGLPLVVGRQKQ